MVCEAIDKLDRVSHWSFLSRLGVPRGVVVVLLLLTRLGLDAVLGVTLPVK